MKAVQIGILAALLLCAGLLFKVYRGQQAPAAAAPQSQTVATTPPAVPESAVPTAPAAPAASPAKTERTVKRRPSAMTAQNRPPELITPATDGANSAAAQAPASLPGAAEPQPPVQQVVLNPPSAPVAPPPPKEPNHATIPAGTVITIRLAETLTTAKNHPGDSFSGTLDQPLVVQGFAIAERGARVEGKILDVQEPGKVNGLAQLALHLTKLHTSDGQDISISTERFAKEGPSSHTATAEKVGGGAALGAIIGAIAGGGKGAAIGAGVGGAAGGGAVAMGHGKPAELPVETRLTFHLQEAVTVTERLH